MQLFGSGNILDMHVCKFSRKVHVCDLGSKDALKMHVCNLGGKNALNVHECNV